MSIPSIQHLRNSQVAPFGRWKTRAQLGRELVQRRTRVTICKLETGNVSLVTFRPSRACRVPDATCRQLGSALLVLHVMAVTRLASGMNAGIPMVSGISAVHSLALHLSFRGYCLWGPSPFTRQENVLSDCAAHSRSSCGQRSRLA